MDIIIRFALPVLIPIILGMVLSNINKNNAKETVRNLTKEHIILRLPKAYLWIGCLDVAFFVACILLMAWNPNGTETKWTWILFILLAFLGIVIIWKTQFWKIELFRNENYFLYRSSFGKTHRVFYGDCVCYKYKSDFLVLKTAAKTMYIDTHTTNFAFFWAMLIQHKVKEIK